MLHPQTAPLPLSTPKLCPQERAQPCCRKPAHHTLASSPDTEERGRRLGSPPWDTVCSQCQLSDAQADPSAATSICVTKLRSSHSAGTQLGGGSQEDEPGACRDMALAGDNREQQPK